MLHSNFDNDKYCVGKSESPVTGLGTPPVVRLDPELQDEWVKEQLQRRHSGQADAHAKEAAELREKLQEAQDELDSTRRDLSAAEKQAAETERALHRYTALSTSNADISQHPTAVCASGLSTAAAPCATVGAQQHRICLCSCVAWLICLPAVVCMCC